MAADQVLGDGSSLEDLLATAMDEDSSSDGELPRPAPQESACGAGDMAAAIAGEEDIDDDTLRRLLAAGSADAGEADQGSPGTVRRRLVACQP